MDAVEDMVSEQDPFPHGGDLLQGRRVGFSDIALAADNPPELLLFGVR